MPLVKSVRQRRAERQPSQRVQDCLLLMGRAYSTQYMNELDAWAVATWPLGEGPGAPGNQIFVAQDLDTSLLAALVESQRKP